MSLFESMREKISVEYVKTEIQRTIYGNEKTFLSRIDPRVLMIWYLVFAIVPWLFFNRTILIGMCLVLIVLAFVSRVSSLILFFLAFGVISDIFSWGIASLIFGGDLSVFWSLTTLILKLLVVSLASIIIFSTMEPDRLSDGLLAMGVPDQLTFGISYGYRMVPVFIEEYHNIFNAYRLRGKGPVKKGLLHWRKIVYFLTLMVKAFYPMVLNTAKRTRTTVEGLEIKGYSYALSHPEVKKLKLAHLKITSDDVLFISISVLVFMIIVQIGRYYPL